MASKRPDLRRLSRMLLLGVAALSSACAIAPQCQPREQARVSDTLYFGADRPGGQVSEADWSQFLAVAVTPRFPDGLTWWRAEGQWRGQDGAIVHETSRVLLLLRPDTPESEQAVTAIADDYATAFQQEAVLRLRSRTCMALEVPPAPTR